MITGVMPAIRINAGLRDWTFAAAPSAIWKRVEW